MDNPTADAGPSRELPRESRKRRRVRPVATQAVDLSTDRSPTDGSEVAVLEVREPPRAARRQRLPREVEVTDLVSPRASASSQAQPAFSPDPASRNLYSEAEDSALARRLQDEESGWSDSRIFAQLDSLERGEEASRRRSSGRREAGEALPLPVDGGLPWENWRATVRSGASGPGSDAELAAEPGPGLSMINRLAAAIFEGLSSGGRESLLGPGSLALLMLGQHRPRVLAPWEAVPGLGRLPAHLVFSDRDFTADDYEALRALDEGLDSRRGAPRDLIRSLPVERLPSGGGAAAACEALGRCVVCLEEFKPGGRLKRLPCGHAFHARCIDRWLRTKAVCPVCQQGIAPETAENDR